MFKHIVWVLFFISLCGQTTLAGEVLEANSPKTVAESKSEKGVLGDVSHDPSSKELQEEKNAIERQDLESRFNKFTQDRGNPKPFTKWFDKLGVSGMVAIDAYKRTYPEESDVSLYAVALNLDPYVNDWVSGHVGMFYSDSQQGYYRNAKSTERLDVDEAYITVKHFASSPFYLRLGRQYLPFGNYSMYPIVMPMTQILSETRETAIHLGFIDQSGFSGAIYTFKGIPRFARSKHSSRFNNFGASLDYTHQFRNLGLNIGVGYLNNMSDVGSIAHALSELSSNKDKEGYHKRVGGAAGYLDLIAGPFDVGVRYTTALSRFSKEDIAFVNRGVSRGAKPRAAQVNAGYRFNTKEKPSKINLFYNWTGEAYDATASSLTCPKNDFAVSYGVNVLKNTMIILRYDLLHNYPRQHGGDHKRVSLIQLRLSILF